ncbi:MAG TPA: site-specific integrase [Methylocella sp.]|jgi:integrase
MSHSSVKLTKRAIDAAPAGAARRIIWDTELRGFGVRIETSGTKTFLIRYRPKGNGRNGPKRFVTIGRYGAMTPEQARNEARSKLGEVARGEDPAETRDQAKGAPTLSHLIERFLAEQVSMKKKASTAALYTHYLTALVMPTLGRKKADSVSHADIAKLHGAIGKTRPVTANRVIATLSGLFSYGAKIGELPPGFNPAKGIEPYKERPRQRYLSTAELARLGDALHQAETIGVAWIADETKATAKHLPKPENRHRTLDPYAIAVIRLLLLTGARLREILNARWDWFDAERGMLLLPDSKTDGKSIYLSSAALSILNALPRLYGNPHIFPGAARNKDDEGKPRADLKKPWAAVTKAAGLAGLRIHDLRHTFASYGAGAHLGLHVIGTLLGHAQPQTTQKYAHLDSDPMHRAVNTIGATISAAMKSKPSTEVLLRNRADGLR